MADVLQTRSGRVAARQTRPEVLSFEKELNYELECLGRLCLRRADHALRQKLSNGLFHLWNKYQARLRADIFAEKLLSTGDTLYQDKEYQLASVHCYGRYLRGLERGQNSSDNDGCGWIVDFCEKSTKTETATFALRAAIGDTACRYYICLQENPDTHLLLPQAVPQVLSVLEDLQHCSQASLQRETHYWLTYNSVLLTLSISRRLLSTGESSAALEPLLWASICTESSLPLLTLRFLRLRTDIYCSVCQCYFQLGEPREAELFARRGLEKVHELALLEHHSNSSATEASEKVFHEATLKLGVVVFRRSVLESRLTRKTVFRPKKRPSIRELLQQLFPRSPTEKLLTELLPGEAARFLAVLEALAEPSREPLAKGLPRPVTSLDADTTADVIQELLCAGTDLALHSLEHWEEEEKTEKNETSSPSLMESAINKRDLVPLASILRYVRMAVSFDQQEVVDLLLSRATALAETSSDPAVGRQLASLRLLQQVEAVRGVKGRRVTLAAVGESQHALTEDPGERLLKLSSMLHAACRDPALLEWERDLLRDSVLFLWDTIRPAFSHLHSHHRTTSRPLTSSQRGREYAEVLEQLVDMAEWIQLWRPHPLLCGELILKLSILKESLSPLPPPPSTCGAGGMGDQTELLEARSHLERGLRWIHLSRASRSSREKAGGEEERERDPVTLMHAELYYALTRVRVKLAATVPPPATPEPTLKPSSLNWKVREREEKAEKRRSLLSSLPAPDTPVASLEELKKGCGHNHYHLALLVMLEAALTPGLAPARRTNLLQEALSELNQLENEQGRPLSPPHSVSSPSPPPPFLLHRTPDSMTFSPSPWHPPHNTQQVAYYRLYGREAEGSNVKVRLSDKTCPGLGTEVAAEPECRLEVKGLKPNTAYVFAVAAYDKNGELLGQQTGQLLGLSNLRMGQIASGGSIGETGRPIVACHSLPSLLAWSYCCQCAFEAGVKEVAIKAARKLWTHFVESERDTDEVPEYRFKSNKLPSTPKALLHHLVHSIFIHVHLTSPHPHHGEPHPTSAQPQRLELCARLLLAVEGCGLTEEPSLCLQAVVMCLGILAPLLQRDIATPAIARVLLHCQSVLCEIPESLLSHTHPSTQSALHHMIASSAFHLSKMLLKWSKTELFGSLLESTRALLLLSMPSALLRNPEIALDQSIGSQAPSLSSYVTASSGFYPGLLIPHGAAGGERRNKRGGRKRQIHLAEQMAEETKSREYRAFEAFSATHYSVLAGQPPLDSSDITGQEDPLLLHAIIATMPAIQAHKEVYKFRRRPQFLQFFVLLATAGMEQGQHHLVLEWAHESFTWLARRNEILLTTRPVHVAGKPLATSSRPRKTTPTPSHPPSGSVTTTTKTATTRAPSHTHSTKTTSALGDSHRGKPHPQPKTTPTTSKTTPTSCKALVRHSGGGGGGALVTSKAGSRQERRSRKGRASLQNERLTRLLALEGVAVTREDIVTKATSVLQTLLPETWRNHKCRKRIRAVCRDELVWRSQANLLLSQCHLEQLLKTISAGQEEKAKPMSSQSLRAGVVTEGDIPTYTPIIPGYSGTQNQFARPPTSPLPGSPLGMVAELMRCLQRALVLAQRGRMWVLLQNICRSLWNSIHCLVVSLPPAKAEESPPDRGGDGVSVAAVYGLASRPLHTALDAIADLLTAYSTDVGHSLPLSQDTAVEPDFVFLERLSLLALRTMMAQEQWEGLVSAGLRLCECVEGEEGEWVREMVPLVLEAQSRLARRVSEHSADLKRSAIEPAAHFDPGPEGHDIYGATGHALAKVCVPLDPQSVLDNLKMGQPPSDGAVHILKRCKKLLTKHLSASNGGAVSLEEDPALPVSPLTVLITHFTEAVSQLDTLTSDGGGTPSHLAEVFASVLHDLGCLHIHNNNKKEAGQCWERGLRRLVRCRESEDPGTWWERVGRGRENQQCGTTCTMLAAILAIKSARYVHDGKAKTSLRYLLTASALFRSLPPSGLPLDVSFLPPSPSSPHTVQLPVGTGLFVDPLLYDPVTSLDSLSYCSRELVERNYPLKALPVLWLYWRTAHHHCRSPPHTLLCQTLRLRALTQLHLFSEALHLLGEVLAGRGVPQTSCHSDLPSEASEAEGFSDSLPLNHPSNLRVLRLIITREIPSSVVSCCGQEAVISFSLARADLYVALASSSLSPSVPPILTRGTNITNLSPSPSPLATPPNSSPSAKPVSRSTSQRQTRLIAPVLLQEAEKILHHSCLSLLPLPSSPRTRIQIFLSLSRLALSLHHHPTATKLSLAALREMQTSPCGVAHRLWLEGRLCLAQSLVPQRGREKCRQDLLDCGLQCGEGVRKAERFGETEWCAQFHFTAALHSLSLSPPNIDAIMKHSQQCLQLLASLHYLSPPLSLLHARCTLLLCDAGRQAGHVTSHDAAIIYKRLVKKLKQQMEGEGQPRCSAYHPLLPLLSSTLLRLSLSRSASPGDTPAADEDPLSLCQEGLDLLERSVLTPDLCLKASLVSQRVSLLWRSPATEKQNLTRELLLAISSLSDAKADYRKLFSCCFEVAWLLTEAIPRKQATPPEAPPTIKRRTSRSVSSLAKKTSPARAAREGDGRRVRSLPDMTKREAYTAWCALKTAQQSLVARETLQNLTSQFHHQDLARPLSEKALGGVPEFVLLELCGVGDPALSSLLSAAERVPVDLLVPSAQTVPSSMKLTWFQVVSFAHSLLARCFWPQDSDNSLPRTHTLTPSLHTQYQALALFLQHHLTLFSSSCVLPSLPPSLLPSTPSPSPKAHTQHLRASENEVTVVWYRPPPNSHLHRHISSSKNDITITSRDVTCGSRDQDDIIVGVFGFNQKAVKVPQPGLTVTPVVEVFAVCLASQDLPQLREMWRELSQASRGYLDSRLSGRPISRSPSRLRKQVEKNQQVQAGIQARLAGAVELLCKTLGREANEGEELPRLEPHLLDGVSSLLPPPSLPSSLTAQGDTFHFLHQLLLTTGPAHCHTPTD